jgi:cysteine desulfurase/selenocysteine lyase
MPIDVAALGVDYAAFSGHKMYGPTGTGFLYARDEHLERAEPQLTGGGMVRQVTKTGAVWLDIPWRFEAGLPNVAGAVGLAAAAAWLGELGMVAVWEHEQQLTRYTLGRLAGVDGLQTYGPEQAEGRAGIFSFTLTIAGRRVHSHDVAQILSQRGVAVRGGHHCAQVLLAALGERDLTRASVGVYTLRADIDRLIEALEDVSRVFGSHKGL